LQIDQKRIAKLRTRELERFKRERPRSMALWKRASNSMPNGVPMAWMVELYEHPPLFVQQGAGAYITDVDGHRYLDMNLADTSMPLGYGLETLTVAATSRMKQGSQFLLPDENSIYVAEELARRFGMPKWQFTLAGSSANSEAIRLSRAVTGRDGILMFAGKYHGMLDETLVASEDGERFAEGKGLPSDSLQHSHIVEFNDLNAVEACLRNESVACVITEPVLTNIGIIIPEPGFLTGLRQLTRQYGCLLIIDEAHTNVCAFGGLTREWQLEPDILTLCKAIGGGVAIGAYGMTNNLAQSLEVSCASEGPTFGTGQTVATGGTLFANALSMATTRAALENVMTEGAHSRANKLGQRLANGIVAAIHRNGLEWSTYRCYCRSGYFFGSELPRNAMEAHQHEDLTLRGLIRLYLANRGIWEAISSASPGVSFTATEQDIDFYLDVFERCLAELKEAP